MDDINTERGKVDNFVRELMGHHKNVEVDMQRFFITNLLRHWNELVKALQQEPKEKWKSDNVKDHPFVFLVRTAYNDAEVSETTFETWIKEISLGYVQKNCLSLPIKMLSEQPEILIDTRRFIQINKGMSTQ